MQRCLGREILDELPAGHVQARQSRRDLQRLNAWMGHAGIACQVFKQLVPSGRPLRVLDLGGGDGDFLLSLARKAGKGYGPVEALIVDQKDILSETVEGLLARSGWEARVEKGDVLQWAREFHGHWDIVLANLFLHHFEREALRLLFNSIALKAGAFLALEPRRTPLALALSGAVGLIGCNTVTRHDAWLSVKAGFKARELSELWPADSRWDLREYDASLCTHVFAVKNRGRAK